MLVSRETQKLVLNLRDPGRVTGVLPSAKTFTYEGHDLVAVPHRLDEVRVLRNMGFDNTPSPIRYYYDWSGSYAPFAAQTQTAEFLTLNPRAFVLNDLGTGKTLASLWAYDYLRAQGIVRKLLVVSPLSTLERTWADEIFRHFPHLQAAVLHGTKDRRLKLLADKSFDIYIINHDGVGVIRDQLMLRDDIDIVIVDEVATFRNASTERWKAMNKVTSTRHWVWGMTGTPTPNSPVDAWAQVKMISPEKVPKYARAWKEAVMRPLSQFKFVPRDGATTLVREAMQPAIRFSRDQCVDLPPVIYQERQAVMTKEQAVAYKDMASKLTMEAATQQVTAVNEAAKRTKLLQIACGVVYASDGTEVVLPVTPRTDIVREIIEEAGGKTIVFVPFKSALRQVAETLGKDFTVEMVSGDVSANARAKIFDRFQNNTDPRVIVAQPASMSHGLTLTAANTIIWYAPTDNNETYEQANGRVTRPGQKLTQFIVHIEGTPLERAIYARLKTKQSLQGVLLASLQETLIS